jgi:hypothetical protein
MDEYTFFPDHPRRKRPSPLPKIALGAGVAVLVVVVTVLGFRPRQEDAEANADTAYACSAVPAYVASINDMSRQIEEYMETEADLSYTELRRASAAFGEVVARLDASRPPLVAQSFHDTFRAATLRWSQAYYTAANEGIFTALEDVDDLAEAEFKVEEPARELERACSVDIAWY